MLARFIHTVVHTLEPHAPNPRANARCPSQRQTASRAVSAPRAAWRRPERRLRCSAPASARADHVTRFTLASSLQCCAGTSSRLGMAHELVTSKLEVLNASRFSIRVFYAFNQFLEPHGDRHREDLVLFARIFSSLVALHAMTPTPRAARGSTQTRTSRGVLGLLRRAPRSNTCSKAASVRVARFWLARRTG